MIYTQQHFHRSNKISHMILCAALITLSSFSSNAAVVARGSTTTSRPTIVSQTGVSARLPSATLVSNSSSTSATTEPDDETDTNSDVEEEPEQVIENKSAQFETVLNASGVSGTDSSADNLAELIRQQRAELDTKDAIETANTATTLGNQNKCDMSLRTCMQEKCGSDFTGCSGDTDTAWGNKMESCRRDADCTGTEYTLFATEIKADRDANAQLASYNAILNCGNQYNDCIMTECGVTFSKCLGKTAGDAAIAKCKTIADNCIQQDSGLASRAMQVFANLRQDAEIQIQKDEERLYELRDTMAEQCTMLGAMFDERTFSCVFTVNFYAGDDSTLYASKKLYAGDVFSCTPDWFGIDITTFMENAYRLTREQTSSSASLLGSGLGVATGAITSGAIDRAIDRQKAENALKDAKDEYEKNYGTNQNNTNTTNTNNSSGNNAGTTSGTNQNSTPSVVSRGQNSSGGTSSSQNTLNETIKNDAKNKLSKPKDLTI